MKIEETTQTGVSDRLVCLDVFPSFFVNCKGGLVRNAMAVFVDVFLCQFVAPIFLSVAFSLAVAINLVFAASCRSLCDSFVLWPSVVAVRFSFGSCCLLQ